MDEFQEEYAYDCPYCGEALTMAVDPTAGKHQSFTVDCEVCCHPIAIHLEVSQDEGVTEFSAEKES